MTVKELKYLLTKNPNAYVSEVTDEVLEYCKSLESQLRAADELAKAALDLRIILGKLKTPMPHQFVLFVDALAAYEKATGR